MRWYPRMAPAIIARVIISLRGVVKVIARRIIEIRDQMGEVRGGISMMCPAVILQMKPIQNSTGINDLWVVDRGLSFFICMGRILDFGFGKASISRRDFRF